ncbi:glycohydrolase toxin TNT-related protein [Microbacterium sp. SD291]|uniref:glycohydrolase toxin TNT-related protein n=1 Tax=Microbacterium sp. SD291 TaxID=2782007 RepID=UPI001A969D0A|nr:glycohydrolase toxin TNT-related protein [Microbacterium sp. SD291]MBO0981425.1 glycohydrolase toxin TNT-related protein [Microbacterium sp. SD291]
MSAIKPIMRELRQAALKGFGAAKDKLHQVAENITRHVDEVVAKVKGQDVFDGPGGSGSGSRPHGGSDELTPRPETLDAEGNIDWDQAPKDGFVLDNDGNPKSEDHYPQPGDRFDRYGNPRGSFVSPIGEDGPFSYESRSMPYFENPNARHEYEWVAELGDARANYDQLSDSDREIVDQGLDYFGQDVNDLSPVARGEAAAIPAWNLPGGATQDKLPVSVEMLDLLGLIREVD